MNRLHIMGAAGSGTTTLGRALAVQLPHIHLDTDDYFWAVKYTQQTEIPKRIQALRQGLSKQEKWILSGAVCGWGEELKSSFEAVIFLSVPEKVRMERLKQREIGRYGSDILPGGPLFDQHQTFMDWASLYETGGMDIRSRALHEHWLSGLSCPILKVEGIQTVDEEVETVLKWLRII